MFTRRFTSMPSLATILAVSGVIIVDSPPPVAINAAPFGKICVVGEFEDGPFATPTDLLTSADQPTIFGGLGFTYGASKYQYACAKRSGGTEYWNGNAWIQTAKLPFASLCFVRVDTSVGQISLTPRAFVQGSSKGPFALANGLTFIFNANGAGNVTVTFAAAAGTHTGTAGTFTSFVGGETLTLTVDDNAAIVVTFQPGDNTLAAIIARINLALGAVIASNATQLKLTSLRLGTGSKIVIGASAAATTLGLTAGTYTGTGDAVDISAATLAEVRTKVQAASALVLLRTSSAGFPRLTSKLGGTGSIVIGAGTANTALGFVAAAAGAAATPSAITIPAGTRASDGGVEALRVVTMQTTTVAAGSTSTVLLKVRPALDDGTFAGVPVVNDVDTLEDSPGDLEWSIGNPAALTAALTAAQLDSAYLTAIASTVGVANDVTKRINGIVSARQSSAIRAALRQNAIDTSANGHFGRQAFLSPPVNSTAATIIGATTAGVQPYRDERVRFVPGDTECVLQELIDGGYATDGVAVRHLDTLLASRVSVLPPGFNPGQLPEEPGYRFSPSIFRSLGTEAKKWDIATYAAFKVAGVAAGFYDKDQGITFEQGITAVDPATEPARATIARATLADFVGDSLSSFARAKAKRQATEARREALKDAIEGFLDTLIEENARDAATVREYLVSHRTDGLPAGVVEYLVAVTPIGSDDVIVFNLKVGANAVALSRAS